MTSDRAPSVSVRCRGGLFCEWCSGASASRYVRFGNYGYQPATDWIDLCDDCARLTRDAITQNLRRRKGPKE